MRFSYMTGGSSAAYSATRNNDVGFVGEVEESVKTENATEKRKLIDNESLFFRFSAAFPVSTDSSASPTNPTRYISHQTTLPSPIALPRTLQILYNAPAVR